jgi:hypothetical protein
MKDEGGRMKDKIELKRLPKMLVGRRSYVTGASTYREASQINYRISISYLCFGL